MNETLPPWPSLAVAVPIAITWWVVVRRLRTGLRGTGKDALVGSVTVYSFGLGALLFSAWATLFRSDWPAVRQALVVCGGTLFSVSDLLLGWDRFVRPWPMAKLHVRITYHLAQLALASSLPVTG